MRGTWKVLFLFVLQDIQDVETWVEVKGGRGAILHKRTYSKYTLFYLSYKFESTHHTCTHIHAHTYAHTHSPCTQIAMTSFRLLHFTFFFKHVIVNISSGSTRLIRRKCSLNRSKCVGNNHLIVYPRCCYNYKCDPMKCGTHHVTFIVSAWRPNDIEEGGRVSSNVSHVDCTFTRDVLFRNREDLQNRNLAPGSTEDTRHIIGRQHRSSLQCFTSTTLVANLDGMKRGFRTRSSWRSLCGLWH